ncbi:MAG: hypothetical protein KC618_03520 [Candidatus Omnitrophica bacterium]|nr:hypothetical protein [Candidatus Omnitrophota bacterium]
MKKRIDTEQKNIKPLSSLEQVLRLTALVYLEEALILQEYERCPELIAKAKAFGASKRAIRRLLAGYARGSKRRGKPSVTTVPRF